MLLIVVPSHRPSRARWETSETQTGGDYTNICAAQGSSPRPIMHIANNVAVSCALKIQFKVSYLNLSVEKALSLSFMDIKIYALL